MKRNWNLIRNEHELYIQQDNPYSEVLVGFVTKQLKPGGQYFEVKLSESLFELCIEINYFIDGSFDLFHTEAQCWEAFGEGVHFLLDTLASGTYGIIRIKKISTPGNEILVQDEIVADWIDKRNKAIEL